MTDQAALAGYERIMTGSLHGAVARITIAAALLVIPPVACGQVYKCTDADGTTTYGGRPLRLLR